MNKTKLYALAAAALALATGPAAAQTSPAGAKADVMKKACKADYRRFCSGVMPGGGRIIACLQNHASELEPDCAKALGK
ncbi:cysteine rich repeat-containing protein [Methylosinus sporium]|uniref:Cysteine rich repeat-containing protein n=1 Tax=Methylosinus sporium TaxID=428 RepID=A0A2U1SQ16_METSR|nr:cysteine rich repeat-containing protein [Methylosinus sporium]PWB93706.1 hypothetical protein C5689_11760 [Methylosinus sporium]